MSNEFSNEQIALVTEQTNLSDQEIKDNSLQIKKILEQLKACEQATNQCPFGGIHLKLKRNKFGLLETVAIKCHKFPNMNVHNKTKSLFLYSDIDIENNNQLLTKAFVDDNQKDSSRIKFVNFLIKNKKQEYPESFYLYGDFSTGKSYLTISFCNEMSKLGKHVGIVNMPIFFNKILLKFKRKDNFWDDVEMIKHCDVLMFDELGNEQFDKHIHANIIYPIVLERMEKKLTTIFVSTYSPDELFKKYMLDPFSLSNANSIKLLINRINKIINNNVFKLSKKYQL